MGVCAALAASSVAPWLAALVPVASARDVVACFRFLGVGSYNMATKLTGWLVIELTELLERYRVAKRLCN